MNGARVTWNDLSTYQSVTGVELTTFEVEAIMSMDASFLSEQSERLKNAGNI